MNPGTSLQFLLYISLSLLCCEEEGYANGLSVCSNCDQGGASHAETSIPLRGAAVFNMCRQFCFSGAKSYNSSKTVA